MKSLLVQLFIWPIGVCLFDVFIIFESKVLPNEKLFVLNSASRLLLRVAQLLSYCSLNALPRISKLSASFLSKVILSSKYFEIDLIFALSFNIYLVSNHRTYRTIILKKR